MTWSSRRSLGLPRGPVLVLLLVLPAMLPFAREGFWQSHDGVFHLFRLMGLERALLEGVLYPRLFPEFAFGYGHAILNYYAPLTYYVALLFRWFGLEPVDAMKAAFALSYPLAGLALYRLARDLWRSEAGAVLAAGAYTYMPYHLADVQLRGALAESWSFVWMPLTLWAALRRRHLLLALSLAALVLTHNLSVLLFAPLLALWLAVASAWPEAPGQRLTTGVGWLLAGVAALLLTAFYWLPVLLESQAVHLALDVGGRGYEQHLQPLGQWFARGFLYRYFPDQGVAAEHPLGWVQWLLLVLAFVSSVLAWVQLRRYEAVALLVLWVVLGGSLFLLTSGSEPLWRLLAFPLGMIQYPWRWLTITSVATALLAGLIPRAIAGPTLPPAPRAGGAPALYFGEELEETPFDKDAMIYSLREAGALGAAPRVAQRVAWVAALGLPLLMALTALPNLPWEPLEVGPYPAAMWHMDYENEQIGATWTAEYLPRWVKEERWAIPRPVDVPAADAPLALQAARINRAAGWLVDLDVALATAGRLVLHQFYLPGWQATVDGAPVEVRPHGSLGLASVRVPEGPHRIVLRWVATPAVRLGVALSVLGAALAAGLWLLLLGVFDRRLDAEASPREIWQAGLQVACALCLVIGIASLGGARVAAARAEAGGLRLQEAAGVVGDFSSGGAGAQAMLLAWKAQPARVSRGDTLDLTLYWLNVRPAATNYKVFVHLTAPGSPVPVAQSDGDPGGGYTPTSRWVAGEIVPDPHRLEAPGDLAPGSYELWAGLYDWQTGERLHADGREDGRVFLGRIIVE